MKIQITFKYLLALAALMLITGELHEQAHINTGYLICGGYGNRDFSIWQTARDCLLPNWSILATAAGPLFSYLVMWTGALLLHKSKTKNYQAIGFSLIFAPLPFARIFTALIGGGDEKVVVMNLLHDRLSGTVCKILAALLVTAICLPPILIARAKIKNSFSWLYIAGFSVAPLIILGIYTRLLLNNLLGSGFLSATEILGTPTLILVHSFVIILILIINRRGLLEINQPGFL